MRITHMDLVIRADNDFYSLLPHLQQRGWDRSFTSVRQLPPGLPVVWGEMNRINHTNNNDKDDDDDDDEPTERGTTTMTMNRSQVVKTGLGSSACLVTSMVGALVYSMEQFAQQQQQQQPCSNQADHVKLTVNDNMDTEPPQQPHRLHLKRIIHNLAQICHCHAQGKVRNKSNHSKKITLFRKAKRQTLTCSFVLVGHFGMIPQFLLIPF